MSALLERDRELSVIDELIEAAGSGRGCVLLLEGPPGIGKTELLEQTQERAGTGGMSALTARGSELERDFPFGVVRQLFDPLLRVLPRQRRAELFSGAAALSEPLFGGEPDIGPGLDPGYPILHGLYWLLAGLAEEAPLLVVIDDAHWSDAASLRFLAFLMPRLEGLRVLVALAARPAESGADDDLLERVSVDRLTRVLKPNPLSTAGTARLVEATLDSRAEDDFCSACHEAARGNPFLLMQLLKTLADEQIAPTADNASRVGELGPRTVSRAVLMRLGRLPDAAAALARAVAVLGDDAELRHAAALAELEEHAATNAADALMEAGILEDRRPPRFVHPIVRAAVHEDLSAAEAGRAHGRAARLLAREGAEPERVSVHLLAAEPAADEAVVELLRDAARRAMARGTPDAAARYLARALVEPPPPSTRGPVLRELGVAETQSGDPASLEHLKEARDIAQDPRERAVIALDLAPALDSFGRFRERTEMLEAEIDSLGDADGDLSMRLEAALAAAGLVDLSTTESIEARLERVAAQARGDTPAGRLLLANVGIYRGRRGRSADEVADVAERALGEDRPLSEVSSDLLSFALSTTGLLFAERYELVERILSDALEDVQARGSAYGFVTVLTLRSHLAYCRGSILDAEADARAGVEVVRLYEWAVPAPVAHLVDALIERGDVAAAERELEHFGLHGDLPDVLYYIPALVSRGRLRVQQGAIREGIRDLLQATERIERWRGGDMPWYHARSFAAAALHRLGDVAEARRLAGEELDLARAWGTRGAIGTALRACGLVEADGIELLQESVATLEPSQARLEHARSLTELGAALRRANRRTDAREPLREALDLAHRCGATVLAERAREELAATGARPRKAMLTGVEALTASERRVARMAAEGLSNREIAQALFVTVKTVETHLGHTYQKLDVPSRKELPRALGESRPAE